MDPFSMLELLLSENQFELILPETGTSAPDTIRLVYLMNDAVESFLLFHMWKRRKLSTASFIR